VSRRLRFSGGPEHPCRHPARGGAGLPARVDRVLRPGRPRAPGAGGSHLADQCVDVHLRPRLRRGRRGPGRGRVLHPRCLLHRRGRPGPGRGVGRRADPAGLAAPSGDAGRPGGVDRAGHPHRAGARRAGRAGAAHPRRGRRVPVPQPARAPRRRRLRAARHGAAAGPAPVGDQARRLLAAPGPPRAGVGGPPRRHPGAGLDHRGVRPARLGRRGARPALVVHRLPGPPTSRPSPSW
jgi:hypothetical protein